MWVNGETANTSHLEWTTLLTDAGQNCVRIYSFANEQLRDNQCSILYKGLCEKSCFYENTN